MKNFQIITIAVFIFLAIIGVLVFSGAIPLGGGNKPGSGGTVTIWGTVKSGTMAPLLEEFNTGNPEFTLKYQEKSAENFDEDLLEALASGVGPDLFFLPDDLAFNYSNKIFAIPYQSYSVATFKNNFSGAGDVFLTSRGILAFPLSVDPLVMYYNQSHLDANGIIYPPATWEELISLLPKLIKKDETGKITKSAVALGHFSNVSHAKDILATLFMQVGNRIVAEKEGVFGSTLNDAAPDPKFKLSSILEFYTNFADPNNKEAYSWNRSFPNSDDAFSRQNLTFYFGYASELVPLINKNPNQDFRVAPFPQVAGSSGKLTGARVTGIAVLSSSKNFNSAFTAAGILSTGDFAAKFARATGVVPARRDLLLRKPVTDPYSPIFYDSALYARSWMDPSSLDTNNIFRRMVEAVLSNSLTPEAAISDANSKLNLLLIK